MKKFKKILILGLVASLLGSSACKPPDSDDGAALALLLLALAAPPIPGPGPTGNTYSIGTLTNTSAAAGGSYTLNVTVSGTGSETLDVYFSTDNIITAADTSAGTVSTTSGANISQSITVPASLTPGNTYYIGLLDSGSTQAAVSTSTVRIHSSNCSSNFSTAIANAATLTPGTPLNSVSGTATYCAYKITYAADAFHSFTAAPNTNLDVSLRNSLRGVTPSLTSNYEFTVDTISAGANETLEPIGAFSGETRYVWSYLWASGSTCGSNCSLTMSATQLTPCWTPGPARERATTSSTRIKREGSNAWQPGAVHPRRVFYCRRTRANHFYRIIQFIHVAIIIILRKRGSMIYKIRAFINFTLRYPHQTAARLPRARFSISSN